MTPPRDCIAKSGKKVSTRANRHTLGRTAGKREAKTFLTSRIGRGASTITPRGHATRDARHGKEVTQNFRYGKVQGLYLVNHSLTMAVFISRSGGVQNMLDL